MTVLIFPLGGLITGAFIDYGQHVIVRVHLSVSSISRPKGVGVARVRGVLIVKKLNKCILNILVYDLF